MRSACNATCSHGGVCTLEVGHEGLHSVSGYCEWERTEGEYVESDLEVLVNTLDALARGVWIEEGL